MKKAIAVVMCFAVIIGVFAACSKPEESETTETTETTVHTTVENPTDKAKIKEADAVDFVKGYTNEELGLSDEDREKCSFMVANSGVKIDGELYINVIAAIKIPHTSEEGKTTYTFDTKGSYYISYDGTKIMKADGDDYAEMQMHEVGDISAK